MQHSSGPSAPAQRRPRWQRLLALPVAALAVLGVASCTMAPPVTTTVPSVELERYLGTWYEVGSVKQFFSVGLVNTKAQYSLNSNGTVRVENSGNYFAANGPESRIVGAAAPVDSTNAKLNVSFAGPPSPNPPGNYWIVDLDADYQWAIVSDPTGTSGFLLSRTRQVSPELYAELLERAAAKGVAVANLTPTPQL
ncbi:MAG: lipocalin family protein [Acidobacteria bacterium]|nr:lipocalin family protein [Acidobacteriota bacterium]